MSADDIHGMAEELKKAHGDDPAEIAEDLGIKIIKNYEFKKLYGLYTIIKRKRVIIINGNLEPATERVVLAHELGHDRLHRELAENRAVLDTALYDMTARPEYEANTFAAELLIGDDVIFELMRGYGYSAEQTAARLGLSQNLVMIKLHSMQLRGMKIPAVIVPENAIFKKAAD